MDFILTCIAAVILVQSGRELNAARHLSDKPWFDMSCTEADEDEDFEDFACADMCECSERDEDEDDESEKETTADAANEKFN